MMQYGYGIGQGIFDLAVIQRDKGIQHSIALALEAGMVTYTICESHSVSFWAIICNLVQSMDSGI